MAERAEEAPIGRDWVGWHLAYDDPASGLSWRLSIVQAWIRRCLDDLPGGPIRVISMCAGQGRDLVGSLPGHLRAADVAATLVELDPDNAETARREAAEAGLGGVQVVTGDASTSSAYGGAVPAHLILACGVFGNITDADIQVTVATLPSLAAVGATVIWTRHRKPPDLTGSIRAWFDRAGFEEIAFEVFPKGVQTIGVHRLVVPPQPYEPGKQLFRFVGHDRLDHGGPAGGASDD